MAKSVLAYFGAGDAIAGASILLANPSGTTAPSAARAVQLAAAGSDWGQRGLVRAISRSAHSRHNLERIALATKGFRPELASIPTAPKVGSTANPPIGGYTLRNGAPNAPPLDALDGFLAYFWCEVTIGHLRPPGRYWERALRTLRRSPLS